jgi:hypothetical protein
MAEGETSNGGLIPMNDTYVVPAGVSAIPRIAEHEQKVSSFKYA